MKKLLVVFFFLFFSHSSFAVEYPNSWKMDILCGNAEWHEAAFVVEVVDDEFTLDLGFLVRWDWEKILLSKEK